MIKNRGLTSIQCGEDNDGNMNRLVKSSETDWPEQVLWLEYKMSFKRLML